MSVELPPAEPPAANSPIASTSLGTGTCDHVVGLAYGWSNSGSHDAYAHWTQVPAASKHAGARTVPSGGLAFFKGGSSGFGHLMISLGGGSFASTDVGNDAADHQLCRRSECSAWAQSCRLSRSISTEFTV